MKDFLQGLFEASEFWALVALAGLSGLNQAGWVDPQVAKTFEPILLGYAGLRATSKVAKAAGAGYRSKRANAPPEYRGEQK
jgi:hypothetical protein